MNVKRVGTMIVLLVITISAISALILSLRNGQIQLEEKMKTFESKLPETILLQNAKEGGWSDSFQIEDEQVFLWALIHYGITEVWRTQYGTFAKYSFVYGGIVYYHYVRQGC